MAIAFSRYLKEAFHARPLGMFVAPNWIGVAAFGLLGVVLDPAFLLLGAGLEFGYLLLLATNPRFRKVVEGQELLAAQRAGAQRQIARLANLVPLDQQRYRALEDRCRGILDQQKTVDISASDLRAQGEGLARLTWIYLALLVTRQNINHVLGASLDIAAEERLKERVTRLGDQVKGDAVSEDLRKSLTGQIEILQQRMEKQKEARDKLAFIEAELTRIEEQVELIREQAAVTADPKTVSGRIDQVAADLTGRSQWLREQQQVYGRVEDLLSDPPPALDVPNPEPPVKQ